MWNKKRIGKNARFKFGLRIVTRTHTHSQRHAHVLCVLFLAFFRDGAAVRCLQWNTMRRGIKLKYFSFTISLRLLLVLLTLPPTTMTILLPFQFFFILSILSSKHLSMCKTVCVVCISPCSEQIIFCLSSSRMNGVADCWSSIFELNSDRERTLFNYVELVEYAGSPDHSGTQSMDHWKLRKWWKRSRWDGSPKMERAPKAQNSVQIFLKSL